MSTSPAYSKISAAAPITIIGKDLDAVATFNADVTPGSGVLKAGTIMKYSVATQQLAPAVLGTDVIHGILSDDGDFSDAVVIYPAMIYRGGTFLRQEIESANNTAITPDSAVDMALRDKGIYLEQSYEGYLGLSPVPAGVLPLDEEAAAEAAAKTAKTDSAQAKADSAQAKAEPHNKVQHK
jgi:hypothetical protein